MPLLIVDFQGFIKVKVDLDASLLAIGCVWPTRLDLSLEVNLVRAKLRVAISPVINLPLLYEVDVVVNLKGLRSSPERVLAAEPVHVQQMRLRIYDSRVVVEVEHILVRLFCHVHDVVVLDGEAKRELLTAEHLDVFGSQLFDGVRIVEFHADCIVVKGHWRDACLKEVVLSGVGAHGYIYSDHAIGDGTRPSVVLENIHKDL